MSLINALILGVIQGLTEFLPVSSSGHLVLVQALLPGFNQPGILFDVILHAGTLVAVIGYFWRKILATNWHYLRLLVVGSLPAGLAGYFFSDFFEFLFAGTTLLAGSFFISALLNFATDRVKEREGRKIKIFDALLVGLAQAVAIVPAISRSGATIFAGSARGIKREEVAAFSFLLSVPAIIGANLLQFAKYGGSGNFDPLTYGLGFVSALVFGLLSIKLTLSFLVAKNFKVFGIYCLIVGLTTVVFL